MQQLTNDREQEARGLSPYKPTIRIDRKIHIKALGLYLRPRTFAIALLALGGFIAGLVKLLGRTK
jgi:hypothetical protein